MKKSILVSLFAGIFLLGILQLAGAAAVYDYNPRTGGAYIYVGAGEPAYYRYYNYDPDYEIYRWDDYDLRWEKDPINAWIQKGDGWRQEALRARAVNEVIGSYENRYALAYGRSSGDVHYYNRYTPDLKEAKPSNWRFKEAYTPAAYGQGAAYGSRYYYEPRFDYETQTFDWRY